MSMSTFLSQLNQEAEKKIERRRKEIASLGMKVAKGNDQTLRVFVSTLEKTRESTLQSQLNI